MSRSYPIWNEVRACIYQSSKSFGAKNISEIQVKVGSGSSNSFDFVSHATKKIDLDDKLIFRFYVDGIRLKEIIFPKDSKGKVDFSNPDVKYCIDYEIK
jgi:hypothetical protein